MGQTDVKDQDIVVTEITVDVTTLDTTTGTMD
jgi:hypothetical protein